MAVRSRACAWLQAKPAPLGQRRPGARRVIISAHAAQTDTHADTQRVSAALVAACMKRTGAWLEGGGGNAAPLPGVRVKSVVHGIKGHCKDQPWTIAVSGVAVRPGPGSTEKHASVVVCLAVHCPGIGGSAPSAGLFDLLLHWGVSDGRGGKWAAPPPEWHTSPPVSYDAGGGAWQTPFNKASTPDDPVHVALLQLPLKGDAMRNGGLSFVLKSSAGRWLECDQPNSHGTFDFFFSLADMSNDAAAALKAAAPLAQPPRAAAGEAARTPQDAPTDDAAWATATGLLGSGDSASAVAAYVRAFKPDMSGWEGLLQALETEAHDGGRGSGDVSGWMVDSIASQEGDAERSLMHRFNAAQKLSDDASRSDDAHSALTALLMWLRLSAARHLTWNKNYNIKPREISAAQERLNVSLAAVFDASPHLRHAVVPAMAAAGRGGSSDMGQRVRDEILAVQSRNHCKGGMMEEWHQKLHNNTSPDDVVICQGLIVMLQENLDVKAYWRTLHASGITAQRLASFDRSIKSEPKFEPSQVPGLLVDLRAYLSTLQAVHSGADLGSAAGSVLGFSEKTLKGRTVTVDPVPGVASPELRQKLMAVMYQQHRTASAAGDSDKSKTGSSDGSDTEAAAGGGSKDALSEATLMLQLVLSARHYLRPAIRAGNAGCGGRLHDLLFLDMALDSAARVAVESTMGHVKAAMAGAAASVGEGAPPPPGLVAVVRLVRWAIENAAVSAEQLRLGSCADDLAKSTKWLDKLVTAAGSAEGVNAWSKEWAMQVESVLDRLKRALSDDATATISWLQPTAAALGERLGVPVAASCLMCEDAVRGTSTAPVAQLLAAVEMSVRRLGGQGEWQVISRGSADSGSPAVGVVRVIESLENVQ
ncbi:hypothetical protein FOA52_012256, partial [Chlamydomonas sp. UWO 241]